MGFVTTLRFISFQKIMNDATSVVMKGKSIMIVTESHVAGNENL